MSNVYKYIWVPFIVAVFLILGIMEMAGERVIFNKCSYRESPFSAEKTKVNIGTTIESWDQLLTCEQESLFKNRMKLVAIRPDFTFLFYNSSEGSYEESMNLTGYAWVNGNFIGDIKEGRIEIERQLIPYCTYNEETKKAKCEYTFTFKIGNLTIVKRDLTAQFAQFYNFDINKEASQ